MKIAGKAIAAPKNEFCVIPRDDEEIIFKAKAVLDYEEFDQLCPEPKPPIKTYPDGRKEEDYNNSKFITKRDEWAQNRSNWVVIESLRATDGLEWETVSYSDPSTWDNYREELQRTFTTGEVNLIISTVMAANSMDDARFEEAKQHFLARQQQASEK